MKKLIAILVMLVIMISFAVVANAAEGVVVEAVKVDKQPNLEFIDDSWGEPVLTNVTSASQNTYLWNFYSSRYEDQAEGGGKGTGHAPTARRFWIAEDYPIDIYMCWDDTYFYFAFKTPDHDIAGYGSAQRGDGCQLWIQPAAYATYNDGITDFVGHGEYNPYWYVWSLDFDDWSTGLKVNEPGSLTTAAQGLSILPVVNVDPSQVGDDTLEVIIAVPWENVLSEVKKSERAAMLKDGAEYAITFLRVSALGKNADDGAEEHGIRGGLCWGKYLKDNPERENYSNLPSDMTLNTVVLRDAKSAGETTPPPATDTNPATEPNLDGVSSWAKEEVEAGIKEGLVPTELQQNYTTPVTRGQVAQMFINLLEKATGKTVDEIMAEKGVAINENAFTDTTDKAVLAANALGIINGTGNGKFSPDGTLKRAQIAAIINRVAKVMGVETEGYTHEFTDITDNYKWADSELGWPVYAGIINGVGGGKFNPGGDLTTEQAILITYRGLNALK